ncbi:hypothetical protein [Dapis sp. BLCC M172]|uniref:hypothetical protein n=1 Tax=Dapis sp. BLCC M172 TaxID=2975281 RepID=UPI003CF546AA
MASSLSNTLEEFARKYKGFCCRYRSKKKSPRKWHWGRRFLEEVFLESGGKRRSLTKPQSPSFRVIGKFGTDKGGESISQGK